MKLGLRLKLILSFALIVVLMAAVNLYGISQMMVLADLTGQMYEHPLQVTKAVLAAHVGVIKIHRAMKDVALSRTPAEVDKFEAIVNDEEKEVYVQFALARKLILGEEGEGQIMVDDAVATFAEWKPIRDEVIRFVRAGQYEEGAAITKTKGAELVAALETEMMALRDYAGSKATTMYTDAETTRSNILMISFLTLGIVILLSGGLAWFVANGITRPIELVAMATKQFAAGDLSQTVVVTSQDEVGVMGQAFNLMAENLRTLIETERNTKQYLESTVSNYMKFVEQVAEGDLTGRLVLSGKNDHLGQLGENLNKMVVRLRDITSKIREATSSISSASAEIVAATTQQASGTNEQSAAINQTTSTISEVKTVVEQTYNKAQAVVKTAQLTSQISQSGQDAVNETVQGMHQIKERVASIAENILALSEQTQQIGEITATVNEIASQSNLLALNASVEAARAGEHGKGFAVVAVEVRNLAEQSRQATAQVKTILNEIQRATNAAVMSTEEGTKGVDAGTMLTEKAGHSILQLAESITESASMAQQILASVRQQTTGMEQITLAMQNINQATIQNLASTRQTERSAQDLSLVARQLENLVAQYKLK